MNINLFNWWNDNISTQNVPAYDENGAGFCYYNWYPYVGDSPVNFVDPSMQNMIYINTI